MGSPGYIEELKMLRKKIAFESVITSEAKQSQHLGGFFCLPDRRLPRPFGPRNDNGQKVSTQQIENRGRMEGFASGP